VQLLVWQILALLLLVEMLIVLVLQDTMKLVLYVHSVTTSVLHVLEHRLNARVVLTLPEKENPVSVKQPSTTLTLINHAELVLILV